MNVGSHTSAFFFSFFWASSDCESDSESELLADLEDLLEEELDDLDLFRGGCVSGGLTGFAATGCSDPPSRSYWILLTSLRSGALWGMLSGISAGGCGSPGSGISGYSEVGSGLRNRS